VAFQFDEICRGVEANVEVGFAQQKATKVSPSLGYKLSS
jgi:hypothetical protein